jgi:hypothetical protein
LKSNKQFNVLCKSLFLKYGCYASIPPESQLIFIVFTSAYIVRQKNVNKKSISRMLDEPLVNRPIIQNVSNDNVIKKDDLFANCN